VAANGSDGMRRGQGCCVSGAPWFNLARQQPQPLQQTAAAVRLELAAGGGRGLSSSASRNPVHAVNPDMALPPRLPAPDEGWRPPAGLRGGPVILTGGDTVSGRSSGGSSVRARAQSGSEGSVRVSLAHAELAACTDGPAWDGGTTLVLSGARAPGRVPPARPSRCMHLRRRTCVLL